MIRIAGQAGLAVALGTLAWLAVPQVVTAQDDDVAAGRELYLTGCVSCHGEGGEGTAQGPTLIGVGAASADFMLRTGRMPLDEPEHQAIRKEPAYDDAEIRQLVAYVASLGPGPEIPVVDPEAGDLAVGGEIYRASCAACHQAAGSGGALSSGVIAPELYHATPTEIAQAVRIGPGEMPVFGPDVIRDDELDSLVRYVLQLDEPDSPGGIRLPAGPVAEGFVALLVGVGGLMLVARWVTATHGRDAGGADDPGGATP